MNGLARLTAAAFVAAALSACAAPAAPKDAAGRRVDAAALTGDNAMTAGRQPEILNAGNELLNVALSSSEVVMTSDTSKHAFGEVTYVLSLDGNKDYNLQLTSSDYLNNFVIKVGFKRLYKGTYTVKAFGDKATEPFATATFRVNEEGGL